MHSGVAHHVLDLVGSLEPERYEIEVACPRASVVWERLEGRDHVRLHEIAPHREPAPADARSLARLLPLVRRADVVHAHSSKAGFLARLAAALLGRPRICVFTPHGWSFWSAQGRRAAFYAGLERRAARWCRTIVTLSESEREAGLSARVGRAEQYRVIPNGVDVARFTRSPAPVPGRILWVGRFAPPKRADLAVRALANVRQRFPEAELHLVGDGVGRPEVSRLAAALGVGASVHLLGTRDDVPDLLAEAACVLLASDYEGCPLSVIEAMAAGVPVVATDVGGVGELIRHGETGLLVEPGSAEALAAGLCELLERPERAREQGEAGRRDAAERFSLERMAGETAALYAEIAHARPA